MRAVPLYEKCKLCFEQMVVLHMIFITFAGGATRVNARFICACGEQVIGFA